MFAASEASALPSHRAPLRLAFPLERQDFTRWLEEHLDLLSAVLGRPMRALPRRAIGDNRIVDLFARDERDASLILIENQLEAADDAHLGQIFVYLAGSGAKTLVWIAEHFSEPRRNVVRWLNEATTDGYQFFAVQIEVARIGGSRLEPVFKVVEAPLGWAPPRKERFGVVPTLGYVAAFWADHLARYPEEALISRQVGPWCRWWRTPRNGVVIAQYIEPGAASVFLRGRQGVGVDAVHATLKPIAGALERRLGVEIQRVDGPVLAQTFLRLSVADPSNMCEVSTWLHTQAALYNDALSELSSGGRRRREIVKVIDAPS